MTLNTGALPLQNHPTMSFSFLNYILLSLCLLCIPDKLFLPVFALQGAGQHAAGAGRDGSALGWQCILPQWMSCHTTQEAPLPHTKKGTCVYVYVQKAWTFLLVSLNSASSPCYRHVTLLPTPWAPVAVPSLFPLSILCWAEAVEHSE